MASVSAVSTKNHSIASDATEAVDEFGPQLISKLEVGSWLPTYRLY